MYVMPTSNLERIIKENGNSEALLDGLLECVSALKCADREDLERVMNDLKTTQNSKSETYWQVGEMLQRIIYFLGNTGGFVSGELE